MNKSTIWTVLGVIAAIVIAWVLVDLVFSVLWFIAKAAVVAVVALVVFFVLRNVFFSRSDSDV
ncbi:hypothetical protein ACPW96_01785 [Micromonospora sp. DT81.3]|uniref:hypothetical protein n=1 Tax=Actinomycetes TaxID=1760 RepID=UPI003CED7921